MVGLKLVRLIERHAERLAGGEQSRSARRNGLLTSVRSRPRTFNRPQPMFIAIWENGCCKRPRMISRIGLGPSVHAEQSRESAGINSYGL